MRSALLILLLAIAGCNTVLNHSYPAATLSPQKYDLLPIQMPANLAKENCGAQALGAAAAALHPPGIEFPPPLLQAWQHDGATPIDILLVARADGLQAELTQGQWDQFQQMIRQHGPQRLLVEFDSTIEVWTPFGFFRRPRSQAMYHWSAVAGMAKDGSALVLAAPDNRDYIIRRDSFIRRWSRADDCLITIAASP